VRMVNSISLVEALQGGWSDVKGWEVGRRVGSDGFQGGAGRIQ
jgi:hypothetical protein